MPSRKRAKGRARKGARAAAAASLPKDDVVEAAEAARPAAATAAAAQPRAEAAGLEELMNNLALIKCNHGLPPPPSEFCSRVNSEFWSLVFRAVRGTPSPLVLCR